MAKHVLFLVRVNHLALAGKGCTFGYQNDAVVGASLISVARKPFAEMLDVKGVFGDNAAVGGTGHRRQESSETRIASKDLDHQEALVAAGRGAQCVGHGDGTRDAGRETDAVIGAGNVVVHGLRQRDHRHPLLVQVDAVGKGVITANGDHRVNAEVLDIGQHLRSEIVDIIGIAVPEVIGKRGLRHMRRTGARAVEEGPAGAANLVDDFLGQVDHVVRAVFAVAVDLDQTGPATADPEDPEAFAKGPHSDRTDGRVEPGDITTPGKDADRSSVFFWICHVSLLDSNSTRSEREIRLFQRAKIRNLTWNRPIRHPPTNSFAGPERHHLVIAKGVGHRHSPFLTNQDDLTLVPRQTIEVRSVVRGKALEQIEGISILENLHIQLDRGVGRENTRTSIRAFLGIFWMRRAVGPEEEARVATGDGPHQRILMGISLQHRKAVEVRVNAPAKDRVPIEHQMMGSNGGRYPRGRLQHPRDRIRSRNVFKDHVEAGHPFDERRQDAFDKDLFAVKDINRRIGDLAMDQKGETVVGHRLEGRHHKIEVRDPSLRIGGGSCGVQLDSYNRVVNRSSSYFIRRGQIGEIERHQRLERCVLGKGIDDASPVSASLGNGCDRRLQVGHDDRTAKSPGTVDDHVAHRPAIAQVEVPVIRYGDLQLHQTQPCA